MNQPQDQNSIYIVLIWYKRVYMDNGNTKSPTFIIKKYGFVEVTFFHSSPHINKLHQVNQI